MKLTDRISHIAALTGSSLKSIVKIALESRPTSRARRVGGDAIVVLGNGPSLSQTMAECGPQLAVLPLLAVNFAALAPEFVELRPDYYVLADPHFFGNTGGTNIDKLHKALAGVDWPMTLFVPARMAASARVMTGGNKHISIAGFNPVGVEGFEWVENMAFSSGRGMPRPRNVLIPALMIALRLGYSTIYVAGADHSWMKTLEVTDDNTVVSVQPHFYTESADEKARITSVYRDIKLHDVIHSFYVAFKSYHTIERYARAIGARIINVTPGSYIDAFERMSLAAVSVRPEATPSLRAENTRS